MKEKKAWPHHIAKERMMTALQEDGKDGGAGQSYRIGGDYSERNCESHGIL